MSEEDALSYEGWGGVGALASTKIQTRIPLSCKNSLGLHVKMNLKKFEPYVQGSK